MTAKNQTRRDPEPDALPDDERALLADDADQERPYGDDTPQEDGL